MLEENKKKTYNQMMIQEDKCKDLKMKLNADYVDQISGGVNKAQQKEINDNAQNLIKKM